MKKLLPIIGIAILTLVIIGWRSGTYSKSKLPYPNMSVKDGSSASTCVQSIANEIYLMKSAHNQHFQSVIEQEKATSEVVGETYESLRTYRCWLDNLCEAVLYSSLANPKQMAKDKKDGVSVGGYLKTQPGCVSAEKIQIPTTKIKYMSYCAVSSNVSTVHADALVNYDACRDLVRAQFADLTEAELNKKNISSDAIKRIQQASAGMVSMETALKKKAAKQKSTILADKLSSIVLKMHSMEASVNQLYEYMEKFDQRLPCYIKKCD